MKWAAPRLVAGLAATLAAGGLALAQPNDCPAAPAAGTQGRLPASSPAEVATNKRYSPRCATRPRTISTGATCISTPTSRPTPS